MLYSSTRKMGGAGAVALDNLTEGIVSTIIAVPTILRTIDVRHRGQTYFRVRMRAPSD